MEGEKEQEMAHQDSSHQFLENLLLFQLGRSQGFHSAQHPSTGNAEGRFQLLTSIRINDNESLLLPDLNASA